ncbi:MAG: RagB/SusD family nutrient uptake outer membrane protein [Parabacteroides sp.]|nr:RagB/SusD family nutrient uptake outer membrane protein [Parabacteroides sp.]
MKTIEYRKSVRTIGVALCAFTLWLNTGCNDFLEEKEVPRITSEFYKTKQGVDSAVDATYSYMRFGVGGEFSNVFTELGTDLITGAEGALSYPYNLYSATLSPTESKLYSLWENHYKAIGVTNLVLASLPEADLTEKEKEEYGAEMSFFRAYFYFDLVQQFGKIPLVTEAAEEPRTDFKRAAVADIYRLIISDLRVAEEQLREAATGADLGKATKYAAAHLLAKVYLTRGSAVTDQRGQQPADMDSAYYYAKKVIDSPNYALVKDFSELWDVHNMGNSEVIFAVQFTLDKIYNGNGNKSHLYWGSWYEDQPGMKRDIENGRPYRFHRPTNKTMFELFDRKNDSRFYKSFKWAYYCNKAVTGLAIGDTAIYYSLNAPRGTHTYKYFQWNQVDPSKNNRYYPSLVKYDDPLRETANEQNGVREWVRMRLGETYLIAAEAAGRKGDYNEAADLINELRKRAAWKDGETKMPQYWVEEGGEPGDTRSTYENIKVSAGDLSAGFVDFILDERGRELLGEYMRWEDLVRCEKLVEYVKKWNPDAATNIRDYHALRPIPQKHIDRLNLRGSDDEEQNPGYF